MIWYLFAVGKIHTQSRHEPLKPYAVLTSSTMLTFQLEFDTSSSKVWKYLFISLIARTSGKQIFDWLQTSMNGNGARWMWFNVKSIQKSTPSHHVFGILRQPVLTNTVPHISFYECNLIDGSSATQPNFNRLFTTRRLYISSYVWTFEMKWMIFFNCNTSSNEM